MQDLARRLQPLSFMPDILVGGVSAEPAALDSDLSSMSRSISLSSHLKTTGNKLLSRMRLGASKAQFPAEPSDLQLVVVFRLLWQAFVIFLILVILNFSEPF